MNSMKKFTYLSIVLLFGLYCCEIQEYTANISADELIQLEFEKDTINPEEISQLIVTARLNSANVESEQDVTFETSGGYFTKLPGGGENLGKIYLIRSSGLKAQIILNVDSTITDNLILGASIKDNNTNNVYPVYKRIFLSQY